MISRATSVTTQNPSVYHLNVTLSSTETDVLRPEPPAMAILTMLIRYGVKYGKVKLEE